jgi:hypothetical protein
MMSWYPDPSNLTTGLTGMINATNIGLAGTTGVSGGNLVSLSLLIPGWFIVFLPMAKASPEAAFTTASFLCMVVSMFLMTLGWLNVAVFVIFMLMTFAGVISFYLHTRN